MAGIQKVPNGKGRTSRYRVRWREQDGTERSQYCPDRASAQLLKQEVEQRLTREREQSHATPGLSPAQDIDLRDIMKGYLRESVRVNQPGTARGHAQAFDIFLRFLAKRYPGATRYAPELLTKQLLADFYDALAIGQNKKPRKLYTRRRIVNIVEYAWAWAADDDAYVDVVPRPRRLRMPKDAGRPTVAPTWTEMDACIAAMKGWQKKLLIVLRFTGLRVQQAMGLRWDDVDLDQHVLEIRGELGKSQQERQGRIIPISPHFTHELAGWGVREGWLIPSRRRPGPRQREARARDARRAWKRAGVRRAAWTQPHHAFRKGFISGLKRAGADADAVEYLVGHSLGLRGVYTDPDALPLRDAVGRIPPLTPQDTVLPLKKANT